MEQNSAMRFDVPGVGETRWGFADATNYTRDAIEERGFDFEWELSDRTTFYHGTSTANLSSILTKGLRPKGGKGADVVAEKWGAPEDVSERDALFLTPHPEIAQNYADLVTEHVHDGAKPMVLKLKLTKEEVEKLRRDCADGYGYCSYAAIDASEIVALSIDRGAWKDKKAFESVN